MNFQFKPLLDDWYAGRHATDWVLGVVYRTEGPCYRKAGAVMFFNSAGEQFGLLSGGCLEADIQLHVRKVMQSGNATTISYDGSDEDDVSFELGIGCGGTVHIALLPINESNQYLRLLDVYKALNLRESCVLQIQIPDPQGRAQADFSSSGKASQQNSTIKPKTELIQKEGLQWLSIYLEQVPHLLIVGGGTDARPVVSLARDLGWEVSLWDSRPANARREYFMSANTIVDGTVESLKAYCDDQCVNAAILMTHNVLMDAAALTALSDTPLKYLGLLGPSTRAERVLESAKLLEHPVRARLAGPAGFDLGGELPESIALSMLSECHAHIHGQTERSVSRKP